MLLTVTEFTSDGFSPSVVKLNTTLFVANGNDWAGAGNESNANQAIARQSDTLRFLIIKISQSTIDVKLVVS